MQNEHSITNLIERLQSGEQGTIQQELWNRYYVRLVQVARNKLVGSPKQAEDEDDAVLNAFHSFFYRIQQGQFPDVRDRSSLWPLLVTITIRKAIHQRRRAAAEKRRSAPLSEKASNWLLEELRDCNPTPEISVMAEEEVRKMLDALDKDSHRQVAEMKLLGFTNREISEKLGVIERTVERRLALIRNCWSEYGDAIA